jgi:hypothetical protein
MEQRIDDKDKAAQPVPEKPAEGGQPPVKGTDPYEEGPSSKPDPYEESKPDPYEE